MSEAAPATTTPPATPPSTTECLCVLIRRYGDWLVALIGVALTVIAKNHASGADCPNGVELASTQFTTLYVFAVLVFAAASLLSIACRRSKAGKAIGFLRFAAIGFVVWFALYLIGHHCMFGGHF